MSSPIPDDNVHSVFSASSAFRWAGYPEEPGCPYSAILASKLPPEVAGPAAEEGTRAHKLLEDATKGVPGWDAQPVPREMMAAVRLALSYIDRLKTQYPRLQIWSEIHIDFMTDVGGKFDLLCYCPETGQVWVIDFKYGKVPVSPRQNPQALCYAVFARKEFKFRAWVYHLVIIQPRDYSLEPLQSPIKEWSCREADVLAWEEQIRRARAEADAKVCRPRADRCGRCRGAPLCEAIGGVPAALPVSLVQPKAPRKKKGEDKQPAPPPFLVMGTAKYGEQVKPKNLDPSILAQIAAAFDGLPALEAYTRGVQAVVDELVLRQEVELPRYKDVYKDARVSWDAEPKTIANELWRLARISPNDVLPQKLICITDAKELLGAAIAAIPLPVTNSEDERLEAEKSREAEIEYIWAEFNKLTKRLPSGERTVVPVTDKRPAAKLVDLDRELTANATLVPPEGAEEIGH